MAALFYVALKVTYECYRDLEFRIFTEFVLPCVGVTIKPTRYFDINSKIFV